MEGLVRPLCVYVCVCVCVWAGVSSCPLLSYIKNTHTHASCFSITNMLYRELYKCLHSFYSVL